MRIGFLVPELGHSGGIQSFAQEVRVGIDDEFEIHLLDWDIRPNLMEKLVFQFLPTAVGKSRIAALGRRRAQELNLASYDVLHAWQIKGLYGCALPRAIITCHGLEVLRSNVRHYERALYLAALDTARVITTPSNWTRDYLCTNFGVAADKVVVIPPPVDVTSFDVSHPKHATPSPAFVIGTLTRFVKRKNIRQVIKALQILQNSYGLDFTYRLAGDGPQRKRILKQLNRSGVSYEYLGRLTEEQKRTQFYPSLDVFVLPPRRLLRDVEGFGIVFVEANAAGVPVVAADTGGIRDAVGVGLSGVFADPSSSADIAAKLNEVLTSHKDWREPCQLWAAQFDRGLIVARFADLYRAVAAHC
jgi:glycosyltransferase involved in cell wall biosynthesis